MEFDSHYLPVILILIIALLGGIIFVLMSTMSRFRNIFFGGVVVVLLFLIGQAVYVRANANPFLEQGNYLSQETMDAFSWFRKNGIRNQVIYAPRELGDKIILLTNNYLYFHEAQELHVIPTAELIDRFTYFDFTNEDITNNLPSYQLAVFGQTFNAAREKNNVLGKIKAVLSGKKFVPETLDSYLAYDYGTMYDKRINPDINDFINTIDRYNVSYMLYSIKDKNSIYRKIPGKIVFENNEYLIKER